MAVREYQGIKFDGGDAQKVTDSLTVEEALQVNINDKPFTITMRTPGNDQDLVRGLLNSEGVLKPAADSPDIILRKENSDGVVTIVDMTIPEEMLESGYSNSRNLLSVSSCGICGRTELEDLSFMGKVIDEKRSIDSRMIPELFAKMQMAQNAFQQSGGSHASAAFDFEGNLLVSMEDIGRHNAVDKVIGRLILTNRLKEAACIVVSGRISYEIVVKTFKARIPILCAVSAPSSLSVDYAKELGITLLAFCRGERATCYAHPERIKTTFQTTIAG